MKVKFEPGSSLLHRLNPLTKLIVLIAYSISIFTFDSLPAEALCFLAMLLLMLWLRSKPLIALIASRYFIVFAVLIVVIQVLFAGGGALLFRIPLVLFSIDVTANGVRNGLIIAFRFLTIIMGSALFIFTTDPNELAYALMKAGLPYRYGFMLVTAIRFIPVFETESGTVRNAQAARGLEIDRGGLRSVVKMARYTLMPLIVSALSRVDVLVISMEGRAFGYRRSRTFTRSTRITALDAALCLAAVVVLAVLLWNAGSGLLRIPL